VPAREAERSALVTAVCTPASVFSCAKRVKARIQGGGVLFMMVIGCSSRDTNITRVGSPMSLHSRTSCPNLRVMIWLSQRRQESEVCRQHTAPVFRVADLAACIFAENREPPWCCDHVTAGIWPTYLSPGASRSRLKSISPVPFTDKPREK